MNVLRCYFSGGGPCWDGAYTRRTMETLLPRFRRLWGQPWASEPGRVLSLRSQKRLFLVTGARISHILS